MTLTLNKSGATAWFERSDIRICSVNTDFSKCAAKYTTPGPSLEKSEAAIQQEEKLVQEEVERCNAE